MDVSVWDFCRQHLRNFRTTFGLSSTFHAVEAMWEDEDGTTVVRYAPTIKALQTKCFTAAIEALGRSEERKAAERQAARQQAQVSSAAPPAPAKLWGRKFG